MGRLRDDCSYAVKREREEEIFFSLMYPAWFCKLIPLVLFFRREMP